MSVPRAGPQNFLTSHRCLLFQIIQVFDSWAHHLSPSQFAEFSLPYAEELIARVKVVHPSTPLIFHANGGTGKLHLLTKEGSSADVIGLDWGTDMQRARACLGEETVLQVGSSEDSWWSSVPVSCCALDCDWVGCFVLQGNVDPMILFGPEHSISEAVSRCIADAGGRKHILNVGHGVIQGTPEWAVELFCRLARESGQNAALRQQSPAASELVCA